MRNLTMLTDLYELTMMYGYFKEGMQKNEGIFDLFFRPKEDVVYAVMAGTESVVEYINNIHFAEEDIAYLRSLGLFDESLLSYLKTFRFTGDLYAMAEGTVVFPYEPPVRVRAPIMEAQLIETAILTFVNPPDADCHQGEPDLLCRAGRFRARIRPSPRAGRGCRHLWRTRRHHRRLQRDEQCAHRTDVRHRRLRHACA